MPSAADKLRVWCELFSALYAERTGCSATDARYIARMLYPVLGRLAPEQALTTVMSDPAFVDDMDAHLKRSNE